MARKNQSNKSFELLEDPLFEIRKEKINKEIKAVKKILDSKVEPLKEADRFFHSMFLLLKEGILSENPNFDLESVNNIIRKNMHIINKIKSFKTE